MRGGAALSALRGKLHRADLLIWCLTGQGNVVQERPSVTHTSTHYVRQDCSA